MKKFNDVRIRNIDRRYNLLWQVLVGDSVHRFVPLNLLIDKFIVIFMLLLSCSSVSGQDNPTLKPIILLIHGRGQDMGDPQGKATALKWKTAIKGPLAQKGIFLQDDDFIFAWYGDILGQKGVGHCTHHEFLPQEYYTVDTDKLKHDGVQAFMNAAAKLPFGQDYLLSKLMPDVHVYLSNQRNQCEINSRVEDALEEAWITKRPIIVIAHSLGSLVAYNVLNRDPQIVPRIKNVTLITIGSMLGMEGVRKALLGQFMTNSLAIPQSIGSWSNFVNKKDFLSFTLADTFSNPNEPKVGREFIISEISGHEVFGYLGTAEVQTLLESSFK